MSNITDTFANPDLESKFARAKNIIRRHRGKLIFAGTATAGLALLRSSAKTTEAFMAEHDLTDEWNAWLTDADTEFPTEEE